MKIDSVKNKLVNRFLGTRNKIIKVKFIVEGRIFEAYTPDDQYWGGIKDVLLNRMYEYDSEFELKDFDGLVVDGGAHVGLFSMVSSVFAKKIVALEPHSINFNLLKFNFMSNRIHNAVALNTALFSKETQNLRLYKGADSGCHSIFGDSNRNYEVTHGVTLQNIIEEFGNIDLLKLDVEGAEFEIFKNADADVLSHINAIVSEIHLWAGSHYIVLEKLTNSGFSVCALYPPLLKKEGSYSIEVEGLLKLKLLRNLVHRVASITGFRDRTLLIFFARRA